jgi:hypothetical protein
MHPYDDLDFCTITATGTLPFLFHLLFSAVFKGDRTIYFTFEQCPKLKIIKKKSPTCVALLLDLDGEGLGHTAQEDVNDARLVRIKLRQLLILPSLQNIIIK